MICFGPIPSRRLGKSLGINNIPSHKICSYSCQYCQVGETKQFSIIPVELYQPEIIVKEVQQHLNKLHPSDRPDYLTFVANGEPTLDINLGKSIIKLKTLDIPVAVITNASLLKLKSVRENLQSADWVSVKIDSLKESTWKAINRPFERLDFKSHINSIRLFASEYKGQLVTETMLVNGMNDSTEELIQTADFIQKIHPSFSYILVPTRPPAVSGIKMPNASAINEAFQIFYSKSLKTELLLGFEGTHTGFTGNAIDDIINICSVHPIREDTMNELLNKDKADQGILEILINDHLIKKVKYQSDYFYLRQFQIE